MTIRILRGTLDEARRAIARLVLDPRSIAPRRLGDVSLWPHQRDAVVRLRAAIAEFGGALLADDVGTGKTFVALAIAADHDAPLVVAPAALRDRWREATSRAGMVTSFVSFEALSRRAAVDSHHDFVIVDEAHHARNPSTKRYGALASLVGEHPTLLLTATPIHNRRHDLLALLALFRGAAAAALDDAALSRCVVRRGREVLGGDAQLPVVHGPIPIACEPVTDDTPGAIMALPPPVPAADAGIASALLAISLLRQWSSSQAALLGAIRRRLATAHALAATLDDGHYPTRAELAWWTATDDVQQVVMTGLLAQGAPPPARNELRDAVAAHIEGLRVLRRAASADQGLDRRRALLLRDVWHAHRGERSIAFSQFAGTVDAYWRELRGEPGICALTADGGDVASGPITRAEALGSFAPRGARRLTHALRIDALLVTDLASEGLDLQDASVLVHLDLPWTPARLEQRVGRIVRPGSPHQVVHVYSMEPPIAAAALLDIRRTLSAKLTAAREALGAVMPDLMVDAAIDMDASPAPAAAERLERILQRWHSARMAFQKPPDDPIPVVAVTSSRSWGWLAVIGDREPRIVVFEESEATDDPSAIARVAAVVDAATVSDPVDAGIAAAAIHRALAELDDWIDSRRAAALAGVGDIPLVRARRRALAAVARLASTPASSRAVTAPAARRALATAAHPLSASRERELHELAVSSQSGDVALVAEMARLGAHAPARAEQAPTLRALIVLVPVS